MGNPRLPPVIFFEEKAFVNYLLRQPVKWIDGVTYTHLPFAELPFRKVVCGKAPTVPLPNVRYIEQVHAKIWIVGCGRQIRVFVGSLNMVYTESWEVIVEVRDWEDKKKCIELFRKLWKRAQPVDRAPFYKECISQNEENL